MSQVPAYRPLVPEPPARSFFGILRDIFLFRLARKHGWIPSRFWVYVGMVLAFMNTQVYIERGGSVGYSSAVIMYLVGFAQWTVLGLISDFIGHRMDWAEWRMKEMRAASDAYLKECRESIERERLYAAEQVKVLAIKTMQRLRQQQDDQDGEGWKRGAGQQPPGPTQS